MAEDITALIADAKTTLGLLPPADDDAPLVRVAFEMIAALEAQAKRITELEAEGTCWDHGPSLRAAAGECEPIPPMCELRSGHSGAHRAGRAEWMTRDPYNAVLARAEGAEAERDALAGQIATVRASAVELLEGIDDTDFEDGSLSAIWVLETLSAPASDVLAAHDRRVRAEALRWAAHNMPAHGCGAHSIYPWLRAEADRIEHTNP
jgi:hypothetical protein